MTAPRFEFDSLDTGPRRNLTAEEFAGLLAQVRASRRPSEPPPIEPRQEE